MMAIRGLLRNNFSEVPYNIEQDHIFCGDKNVRMKLPITWNHIAPRIGDADPLWELLLITVATICDKGNCIRFRGTPTELIELHYLVNGTWYELVPPIWRMKHLISRMAGLTARGWWDWWRLIRINRRFLLHQQSVAWERTFTIHLQHHLIAGNCMVQTTNSMAEVIINIGEGDNELILAATPILSLLGDLIEQNSGTRAANS